MEAEKHRRQMPRKQEYYLTGEQVGEYNGFINLREEILKMQKKMIKRTTACLLAGAIALGGAAAPAVTAEAKSSLEKSVETLVTKAVKKETNQKKQLRKLFNYVEKNYGYARVVGFQNSKGWEKTYAKEMIKNKQGSCYHYAALYAFLAKKAANLPVRICIGTTNGFNKSVWQPHAWCEIKIGRTWYVCDANMDKFAAKSKGKYFLKSIKSMKSTYKRSKTVTVKF